MINDRMYVDIHIIQTVPPSNLNRDDSGSPKQAVFGGVRRARVSSQSWKRATRITLAAKQPLADQATRTKRLARLLADGLITQYAVATADAERVAQAVVASAIKMDAKKNLETSYLLFFGRSQVDELVAKIASRLPDLVGLDEKSLTPAAKGVGLVETLGHGHPLDVALFGRMVADIAELNVDASTQVAHAISTHPVDIEFDYFTAVDDENTREETGAGMIGTVEFNSATLYRYATVAVHELSKNLGDTSAVVPAVREFVDAFARSMPSGKQNSFGNRTRPSMVLIVVRGDQPVSLVSAFENPVLRTDGIEAESMARLAEAQHASADMWGDEPLLVRASYATSDSAASRIRGGIGASVSFPELLDDLSGLLSGHLVVEGVS